MEEIKIQDSKGKDKLTGGRYQVQLTKRKKLREIRIEHPTLTVCLGTRFKLTMGYHTMHASSTYLRDQLLLSFLLLGLLLLLLLLLSIGDRLRLQLLSLLFRLLVR